MSKQNSPTPGPINLSVSTTIDAPADVVFDLITDIDRMPEWSPQISESRWVKGTSDDGGAAVGAVFFGKNVAGTSSWSTKPKVTELVPGRVFEFNVPFPSRSTWRYELTPVDGGTRVTESLSQTKRMPGFIRLAQKRAGITDRAADLKRDMHVTLERIAAAATNAEQAASA